MVLVHSRYQDMHRFSESAFVYRIDQRYSLNTIQVFATAATAAAVHWPPSDTLKLKSLHLHPASQTF